MTGKLSGYSTTPANNNAAAPNGWPEGMTAGSVNNATREYAARVREWYEDPMWIDYGHYIVSSTSSSIKVSGDQTAVYVANRPIRVNQSGSQVGYITASAYSAPDTSITVSGFTVSGPTQVEAGAISSSNQLPANLSITTAVASVSGTLTAGNVNATTASITTATFATITASVANIASASITSMNLVGTLTTAALTGGVHATQAQMEAATATNVVVNPAVQKYHPLMPKAWGKITSGAVSLTSGISASNRTSLGEYSITMAATLSSSNYAVIATPYSSTAPVIISVSPVSAYQFRVYCYDAAGSSVDAPFGVAIFGDLP